MNNGTSNNKPDAHGFEAPVPTVADEQVGAVSAIAREKSEMEAAVVSAKHFPRNEADAYARLVKSAKRPGFAEGARYTFPRGGRNIEGPSVKMAREAARCWGNIQYGVRLVSMDDKFVHIKGWALDLETNAKVEMEDKFERLIFRKQGGWVKPDERDLRELINKRGAICVRNAVLQIIPPDVIDDMMHVVRDTMVKAANGEVEQSREEAVRRIVVAFGDFGVKTEMIEAYLTHNLETITPEELADLREVYTTLKDGQAKVADYFKSGNGREPSEAAANLNAAAKEQAAAEQATEPGVEDDVVGMDTVAAESMEQMNAYMRELGSIKGKKAYSEWIKKNGGYADKLLPEHAATIEKQLEGLEGRFG